MTSTDDDLLRRAGGGDREALAALLERHGPAARRVIAGRIPDRWRPVLAEDDVMQQTYADAALAVTRFVPGGDGSFAAWLATLARCNLADALRNLGAEKRGGDRRRVGVGDGSWDALYQALSASIATPSRDAARAEGADAVRTAVAELPETYRRVVEELDLKGRSVGAVARDLGRSPGAVYMLRARAHDRIAERLGTPSRFFSSGA